MLRSSIAGGYHIDAIVAFHLERFLRSGSPT